ncbi:TPA: nicotinamide riboside transporter PnuC [Escherichia coli]|uniref:nicotinamide riboside transporter PnuC n=1 Tax=Escherichia coli TaxID=562 RepID=UPI00132C87A4|nr:nicotinamide riboside transporter PnuC [Escherichia coli]MWR25483.1 nicotinamide riboside transporter PnuC [Escherichia coli]MWS02698.1 nicotinamide riboside transporter PnuC [Escherichia coli]MWS07629.1 nicotinamide riboside transporter PnuC [Escherichia coli]MWS45621.1 nicotinamide riboside transporter PnuC [Escherichia coli]MWS55794.1 nicotinamide riboside transporter PnuC [Escherichia coli]
MDFFSINNVMVHILLGEGGYALSWIETIGTIFGLLCIWCASREKTINYLFGLINVTLFAAIFFQIQLYASLLLQVFFFAANIYGWYAWSRQNEEQEAALKVRWLSRQQTLVLGSACIIAILLMTLFIDPVFATLTRIMLALLHTVGMSVIMPELLPDAFPFWDSTVLVLSIAAMVLMTRKYVENWLLWVLIDVISVVIYTVQGVYAMSLEYILLTAIAVMGSYSWILSAKRNGYTPLAASVS